jgi:hypothetical protein
MPSRFAAVRTGVEQWVQAMVRTVRSVAVEPLKLTFTARALAAKEPIVVEGNAISISIASTPSRTFLKLLDG